jgi:hypothetical protein
MVPNGTMVHNSNLNCSILEYRDVFYADNAH